MPIILFDGVCNFCNRAVQIILAHDKKEIYQFASIQSDVAAKLIQQFGLDPKTLNTVILIEGEHIYIKTAAITKISANLSGWPYLFSFLKLLPNSFVDFFYDQIAKYRYRLFRKQLNCTMPHKKYINRFLV